MGKCLTIVLLGKFPPSFVHDFIHKQAKKLHIEGTATVLDQKIKIVACGTKEEVDSFVDLLHKGYARVIPESIEIEPFLRDKDYRGVFRIIE